MKTFLVIAEQGSGCDYTIGCGVKTWTEYADSMEELVARIKKELLFVNDLDYNDDDYEEMYWDSKYAGHLPESYNEHAYDQLTVYEIRDTTLFNMQDLARERKRLVNAAEAKRANATEKAEYERLRFA